MSVGNLKDQGNKGNNFPYQLRNLQLLGEILTALSSGGPTPSTGSILENVTSKMNRIQGSADYNRALSYVGGDVSTIVHTGTTLLGVETITETFTYVGGNVTNIAYS